MDWIHCNKCFSQLETGVTLQLTSCGHMFCNKCLGNGVKENTCLVCCAPCSLTPLAADMQPEIQDYFTDPEEIIKKSCEVLQFQRQHRRRLLSYLLQSTKKFYTARSELQRMTELCQKQHKQLKEYSKTVKKLEAQLASQSNKQSTSPFNVPISPSGSNLSPSFIQCTPTYRRPAKSTPYNNYQSNLVTPTRVTKQRTGSAQSQRSNTSGRISSTVFTPPTPESAGSFLSSDSDCESGYLSNGDLLQLSPGATYCNGSGSKCTLPKYKTSVKTVDCQKYFLYN